MGAPSARLRPPTQAGISRGPWPPRTRAPPGRRSSDGSGAVRSQGRRHHRHRTRPAPGSVAQLDEPDLRRRSAGPGSRPRVGQDEPEAARATTPLAWPNAGNGLGSSSPWTTAATTTAPAPSYGLTATEPIRASAAAAVPSIGRPSRSADTRSAPASRCSRARACRGDEAPDRTQPGQLARTPAGLLPAPVSSPRRARTCSSGTSAPASAAAARAPRRALSAATAGVRDAQHPVDEHPVDHRARLGHGLGDAGQGHQSSAESAVTAAASRARSLREASRRATVRAWDGPCW